MSAADTSAFPARLLVIDHDRDLADAVSASPERYRMRHAATGRAGAAALQETGYEIILADIGSLADLGDAGKAITRLARLGGSALLIVTSTKDSVSAAVEALQAGAHECLVKPVSIADLDARIASLRAQHEHRDAVPFLTRANAPGPDRFIASAPQMQIVRDHLEKIAASPAPVMFSGESGTGKHLAAEILHLRGPQAGLPFIAMDCVALPSKTASETDHGLFHLAGTEGAKALVRAGGGTLYLHRIDALDAKMQARLLGLVAPGDITIEGDDAPVPLKLRIVCSTQLAIKDLLDTAKLREDLFYRLNVLPIHLPPLRQRQQDIAPLAASFLRGFSRKNGKRFANFSKGALAYLAAHEWPGNVHELKLLMQKLVAMFDGVTVTPQMLAAAETDITASPEDAIAASDDTETAIMPMWQHEQRIIEAAIAHYDGNIAQAAAALEISPSTIYRKKQGWDMQTGTLAGAA